MILDLLKIILTIPFVLVLPGVFFLLAIFGWKNSRISFFEKSILAVPMSLIVVNLIFLFLNKLNFLLRGPLIFGSIVFFCLICFAIFQFRFGKYSGKNGTNKEEKDPELLFDFSFWQLIFILLSISLAIFIRTAYLSDTILPSSTDLGHHMYWVQTIIDRGHLPDYGMPDFIIGEHIVFAAINLLSGIGVATAMPALVLLLFNITGIFTLAILVARLFKNKNMIAASFLVSGVLYAVAAPQGKYVSGGVVGNIIGDMLIPVALFFIFLALKKKNQIFAGLFIFTFLGLLYTHHLSSFVLIFSVMAILFLYLILNLKKAHQIIHSWLKIFLRPIPLAILAIGLIFLMFVYTPTYFNRAAIDQATGAPSKLTRVGLDFQQIEMNAGSARLVLGVLGFLLLTFSLKTKKLKYAFALGWFSIFFIMAWKPGWLLMDIPSSRIGNYLFLPISALAAYGIVKYVEFFRGSASGFFSTVILFTLMFFLITDGLSDSADAFKVQPQFQETMETFHSAEYLANTIDTNEDVVLKDHVNIYGDSWYKLFFMKDYKYPLSRGNLSRYADPTKPRENCTLDMISSPQSESGRACYAETKVNYVALNARLEGNSFEKYPEFSKVYSSNYISIFRRD